MVSKLLKKTPTKCLKDSRRHRKRIPSPAKIPASSTVLASINKSLSSCRRRIAKLFSKLACITTPSCRRRGYQILKKPSKQETLFTAAASDPSTARRTLFFDDDPPLRRLPPPLPSRKKTIFLDLDETLIHSRADPPPQTFDFVVRPEIDGEAVNFYVLKRPGVHEFLHALSQRYELVVFTAGLREYASLVIDRIDQTGAISHRLYRDSCREIDGRFVKDLAGLGRDLNCVAIVDDNPNSYTLQPENAIPIRPFIDDAGDRELGKLLRFFDNSAGFDDLREAAKLYRSEIQ